MATSPHRLKRRGEFLRVAAKGRKVAVHGLVLQALSRDAGATPAEAVLRIGFTVTRKVGNAVIRNRTRRRLREAARLLLGKGYLGERSLGGYDLVLIGRDSTRGRRFDLLLDDLARALEKAGVA